MRSADLTVREIEAHGGPAWPNVRPYSHITAAMVVWNEAHRLVKLFTRLRSSFDAIAVVVQASTDNTLEIVTKWADIVVSDEHRGYGDASFGPYLLPQIKTRWTLKIDADEMPTPYLLKSLSSMTWLAERERSTADGVWIPFRSAVEGGEWKEQHAHLRLFQTHLGWPKTLHSRPMTDRTLLWTDRRAYLKHFRSLAEVFADYARYYEIGRNDAGHTAHNVLMLRSAAEGTARIKGWDHVKADPNWPTVEKILAAHP